MTWSNAYDNKKYVTAPMGLLQAPLIWRCSMLHWNRSRLHWSCSRLQSCTQPPEPLSALTMHQTPHFISTWKTACSLNFCKLWNLCHTIFELKVLFFVWNLKIQHLWRKILKTRFRCQFFWILFTTGPDVPFHCCLSQSLDCYKSHPCLSSQWKLTILWIILHPTPLPSLPRVAECVKSFSLECPTFYHRVSWPL